MEKLNGMSMDVEQSDRDKLQALFPQCFVEGKLDIDKLLTMCGEYIDDDFEKYEFKWKGKRDCLKLAQMRSTATLRSCPEESVSFDTTKNLYIEGDNLEVLKLLQKAYFRRVKMIYIDPPYNTGNDFVYEDDFSDTLDRYREVTSQATKSNPETMGRFHTNWLNMIYPRLRLSPRQGVLGQTPHSLDIGFKLDSSNLKTWDSTHISAEAQKTLLGRLNAMIERGKPYRTDLDMVYKVMLKLGVPLDFPVAKMDVNGVTAYSVGEDCLLLVCLEPGLDVETLELLVDYGPAKMILAETSFADDSAMSNTYYTLRDRGIEFKFV